MNYTWDFSVVWEFRQALLGGLLVSIKLTLFCIVVGTASGLVLTMGLIQENKPLRFVIASFTEMARALPVLVLMICAYYMTPPLTGFAPSAFWTAAYCLAFNMAGFAAEIFRGSITAIPKEHIEAGYALGMTRAKVLQRVIIPEAFNRSIPALTAMGITMFKLSTVASVISVYELLHSANTIILDRFKPLEIYASIAVIYLLVIIPITLLAKRLAKHRWFTVVPGAD